MESRTDRDGVPHMSATPDEGGATRTDESGTDKAGLSLREAAVTQQAELCRRSNSKAGRAKCGQTGSGSEQI